MFRNSGGHKVGKGTYWNLASGLRVDIDQEGILPGTAKETFFRIPAGLMLLAGPLMGLVYVIMLPFIAIGTFIAVAAGKVAEPLVGWAKSLSEFGWRPREAYLSGRKKKGKKKE